jgi:transposase
VIFNLPDYHMIDAVELPLGGRRVIVRADDVADGCPECGVISVRVHPWCRQRVTDVPHAGPPGGDRGEAEAALYRTRCPRRTFTLATGELQLRAR